MALPENPGARLAAAGLGLMFLMGVWMLMAGEPSRPRPDAPPPAVAPAAPLASTPLASPSPPAPEEDRSLPAPAPDGVMLQ